MLAANTAHPFFLLLVLTVLSVTCGIWLVVLSRGTRRHRVPVRYHDWKWAPPSAVGWHLLRVSRYRSARCSLRWLHRYGSNTGPQWRCARTMSTAIPRR